MTDHGDENGDANRLETAPAGIGEVSTKDGHAVDPESVESGETGGGLLTLTEGTRLVVIATCTSATGGRSWLLDEVLEDLDTSVVRESLCQLAESDSIGGPGKLLGDTAQSGEVLVGGGCEIFVRGFGFYANAVVEVSDWVELILATVSLDVGDVDVALSLCVASDGVVLNVEGHDVEEATKSGEAISCRDPTDRYEGWAEGGCVWWGRKRRQRKRRQCLMKERRGCGIKARSQSIEGGKRKGM